MIRSASLLLAAASLMLPCATGASAQQVEMTQSFVVDAGMPLSGMGGVNRGDFERYIGLLDLDEAQLEAAMILHEVYQDDRREASRVMMEKMQAFQDRSEEPEDMLKHLEELSEVTTEHTTTNERLDQGLLSDLRSLLTEAQAGSWGRVERARRRDTTLPGGMVPGGGVDLVKILTRLELIGAVGEQVDLYEQDLDRVLVERAQLSEEQNEGGIAGMISVDPDSMAEMQERMETFRKNAIRVRDVNRRHTRSIEAALPEADRAGFVDAVKRQTHPRIFRESHTEKVIKTALGLADLTEQQRAEITRISDAYGVQRADLDDRWASEVDRSDDIGPGGFGAGGGSFAVITMTDASAPVPAETPIQKARAARRALDTGTTEQVAALLNDEQQASLPKKRNMMFEGLPEGIDIEFDGLDADATGAFTETIIIGG